MNSFERVENCMHLGPVRSRDDIPVYPMTLSFPAAYANRTMKEATESTDVWLECLEKTFQDLGWPDLCQGNPVGDVMFLQGLEALRPGYELGECEPYQFRETIRMDVDGYQKVLDHGWFAFYNDYLCTIQHPPMTPEQLGQRWMTVGMNAAKVGGWLGQHGLQPIHGTAFGPAFDTFSMIRSFGEFCYDLADEPELIQRACLAAAPQQAGGALAQLEHSPVKRASIYCMRSSVDAISPAIFDEFAFPPLKIIVETLHQAGVISVIHADGNWLPLLPRLLELPKGSCHVEFDGATDLFQAAEIIQGWHSFRGDVPATLMAFGTADEVSEYCESLISRIGMKGGFCLGSGCEIPHNCKPENFKAMIDAVRG